MQVCELIKLLKALDQGKEIYISDNETGYELEIKAVEGAEQNEGYVIW